MLNQAILFGSVSRKVLSRCFATQRTFLNSSHPVTYKLALDFLQKSLKRNIDLNNEIHALKGKKETYYDYNLLKLCQLHNISLTHILENNSELKNKLDMYKLPSTAYVGLSSGIDSTFSAAMLTQLYPGKIVGVYMQNWGQQQDAVENTTKKCWEKDVRELYSLKQHKNLRIDELVVKSFEKEYWMNVFEPFLSVYSRGETPNPDIYCNSLIKFKALMEYIDSDLEKTSDRDYLLVMGHYCQRLNETGIHMAYDKNKDQSYYLSRVAPQNLKHCWFPLGHITKKECREYSKELLLPNFNKKDSVGICFVENEKRFNESSHTKGFSQFLSEYIENHEGDFVSYLPVSLVMEKNGKIARHLRNSIDAVKNLDEKPGMAKIHWKFKHQGLHTYTIGQRIQAVIPQIDGFKGKWYLSDKNIEKNELVIVNGKQNPSLFKQEIHFKDSFEHYKRPETGIEEYMFKHRSLHLESKTGAIGVKSLGNSSLIASTDCSGVSKGQFVVVYDAATKQVQMNAIIAG